MPIGGRRRASLAGPLDLAQVECAGRAAERELLMQLRDDAAAAAAAATSPLDGRPDGRPRSAGRPLSLSDLTIFSHSPARPRSGAHFCFCFILSLWPKLAKRKAERDTQAERETGPALPISGRAAPATVADKHSALQSLG